MNIKHILKGELDDYNIDVFFYPNGIYYSVVVKKDDEVVDKWIETCPEEGWASRQYSDKIAQIIEKITKRIKEKETKNEI